MRMPARYLPSPCTSTTTIRRAKPLSSIDVDLPDGIGDDDYLAWLDNALSSGLRQFEPDLICYIAGADPYRRRPTRRTRSDAARAEAARRTGISGGEGAQYSRDGHLCGRLCRESGRHGGDPLQYGDRGERSIWQRQPIKRLVILSGAMASPWRSHHGVERPLPSRCSRRSLAGAPLERLTASCVGSFDSCAGSQANRHTRSG